MTSQVHLNGTAPILWVRKLRHKEIKQLATVTELVIGLRLASQVGSWFSLTPEFMI